MNGGSLRAFMILTGAANMCSMGEVSNETHRFSPRKTTAKFDAHVDAGLTSSTSRISDNRFAC
jgi:hypothetical protein